MLKAQIDASQKRLRAAFPSQLDACRHRSGTHTPGSSTMQKSKKEQQEGDQEHRTTSEPLGNHQIRFDSKSGLPFERLPHVPELSHPHDGRQLDTLLSRDL